MTYSIIGTGNMAWFLAKRLKAAGMQCMGVYGRNAKAVTALTNEVYATRYGTITDVNDDADAVILAVSDYAIGELAGQIALDNAVLIHTAGSVSIDILADSANDKAVLWPVYSILKTDLPLHRNIPCAWEASSDRARQQVLAIANSFSDHIFEARGEQRRWLHLSAVMSNNFINHLMAICEQICTAQGLPFTLLHPIIQQTVERIATHSPAAVQTGPAKRNDQNTIHNHLELLKMHPEWAEVYKVISSSIEKMYSNSYK